MAPPFADWKGIDCCVATPDSYKIVAELPMARLVEMTLKAGMKDNPHDHPAHYMYVVTGGKLKLVDEMFPDGHEVELPTGAPVIMPAGVHQVENVGDNDVKVMFVEPTPLTQQVCPPCAPIDNYTDPFKLMPQCYKVLAEDEFWMIGEMKMDSGFTDTPHSHLEHLVYVVEGNGITIYPGGKNGTHFEPDPTHVMKVPIQPGMAMPVPRGHHVVTNNGDVACKLIFFEVKATA